MRILVGLSGAISILDAHAYLQRLKAEPEVQSLSAVMTPTAARFVEPRVLEAYLQAPVRVDPWRDRAPMASPPKIVEGHDLYLVLPAGATTIARCAGGSGETLVAACYLCFTGPVVFAPSMPLTMYRHPAVVRNVALLEDDGAVVLPPGPGRSLVSGETTEGGLCSYKELWSSLRSLAGTASPLTSANADRS